MKRYNKLTERLFSADLRWGEISINPTHTFSCFLIIQHEEGTEFIQKNAVSLLLSGCREFGLFGEKWSKWKDGIVNAHRCMFPVSSPKSQPEISVYGSQQALTDKIREDLSLRPFIPHDMYLLYDDDAIYQEALKSLGMKNNMENNKWTEKND